MSSPESIKGEEYSILSTFPIQLLVESLPLLIRQSCARTETAGRGGLGTGCKEDIASSSSVMGEETPGGGWDRGDRWQAGEILEVREMGFG